ncbi:MAG: hypothetical protein MJB14_11430 [Spirochaetes bacterium]|nr:hypothetical protein [Spirochaetota bacterium]
MKIKKKFTYLLTLILITSFILLGIYIGFQWLKSYLKLNNKNPYEYSWKEFEKIDEKLILHEEVASIISPYPSLTAMAITRDNQLIIGNDSKLSIYNQQFQLLKTIDLSEIITDLAIDQQNFIYIAHTQHVKVISLQDNFDLQKKKDICYAGENSLITAIAVTEKYLYIADRGNKLVYVYEKSGTLVKIIDQNFIIPGQCFDLTVFQNQLIVANPGKHQIITFDSAGNYLESWQASGMDIHGFSGCCNPIALAVLKNGSLVTGEKGIPRLKIVDQKGKLISVVASPQILSPELKQFKLRVSSSDDIFLMDTISNKIRIFRLKEQNN